LEGALDHLDREPSVADGDPSQHPSDSTVRRVVRAMGWHQGHDARLLFYDGGLEVNDPCRRLRNVRSMRWRARRWSPRTGGCAHQQFVTCGSRATGSVVGVLSIPAPVLAVGNVPRGFRSPTPAATAAVIRSPDSELSLAPLSRSLSLHVDSMEMPCSRARQALMEGHAARAACPRLQRRVIRNQLMFQPPCCAYRPRL
jgi:hypothetical protein